MGQYYNIVNIDKKEYMDPGLFEGCDSKLMEWPCTDLPVATALLNLMADRWQGDRVYVVGDYAEADDPRDTFFAALEAAEKEFGTKSLHEWAEETCALLVPPNFFSSRNAQYLHGREIISEVRADISDHGWRYIINHDLKQYIDLTHCPVFLIYEDEKTDRLIFRCFSPLPMLLAMGNGRGGGDYPDIFPGHEFIGTWCDSVTSVRVRKDLGKKAAKYTEFYPGFVNPRVRE